MTIDDRDSYIHVTLPGSSEDPRSQKPAPPGVVIHPVPQLHPDDITVLRGIPVTTPARTLIDCAEVLTRDELREALAAAYAKGLVTDEAIRASRARVEWRPSLQMFDELFAEFRA